MRIDFNEEKHEYSVNGEKVPSVSEILAPLSADRYGGLNTITLQEAARRGRAVHELTEAIDFGMDISEEMDAVEFEAYVDAYYLFLIEHEVEWLKSEEIVGYYLSGCYRTEDEPPLYAGTIDRFGWVDGKLAVVDFKTYASMSTDAQMAASCQTALYAECLQDEYEEPLKRYILHLKKDGKYRLIDLHDFDQKRGWNGGAVAWELYEIWRQKEKCLKQGRRKK